LAESPSRRLFGGKARGFPYLPARRAEEAAVIRFGDVAPFAARRRAAAVTDTERGTWTIPYLLLTASVAVCALALLFGSYAGIEIALGLAGAVLFLAAIFCGRRGVFPGLAFGMILMMSFAGLSVVAGLRFLGPGTGFVERSDAPQYEAALVRAIDQQQGAIKLMRAGARYVEAGHSAQVPSVLRTGDTFYYPSQEDIFCSFVRPPYGFRPTPSFPQLTGVDALQTTGDPLVAYKGWKDFVTSWRYEQAVKWLPRSMAETLEAVRSRS